MRFIKYINEAKELSSMKSEKWSGILYRATDSKAKGQAALGRGIYLTPDTEVANYYGKKIKKYQTKPIKVLGTNSREYDAIKGFVNSAEGFEKYDDELSVAQMIRLEAEERGFDAIYGGDIYGLVLFDGKKIKEIK